MKAEIFHLLTETNLVATLAIAFLICIRPLFRRYFGAQSAYKLWAILPVSLIAALLPARRSVDPASGGRDDLEVVANAFAGKFHHDEFGASIGSGENLRLAEGAAANDVHGATVETVGNQVGFSVVNPDMIFLVWGMGVIVSLCVLVWRQSAYIKSLGTATPEILHGVAIWRSERIDVGPAVSGIIRPRIIIPFDFENWFAEREQKLVLAHEKAHLAAGDIYTNLYIAFMQCFFWFNPLIYIAARNIRNDQELACDATVIDQFPNLRRQYAETLLASQTVGRSIPVGCMWPSASKRTLRNRIANLPDGRFSIRKRKLGIAAALVLGVASGAAAWASQPPVRIDRLGLLSFEVEAIRIENLAANLIFIAEDRDDVEVSFDENSKLPRPAISDENNGLLIDGGLALKNKSCSDFYDENGRILVLNERPVRSEELPKIIIRAPRDVDIAIQGIVRSQITGASGARVESNSCEETSIRQAGGALAVYLLNDGDVDIDLVDAPLDAHLYGFGNMNIAGGRSARLELNGAGIMNVGEFSGAVKARLNGTGNINIVGIGSDADLGLTNSGNINVETIEGNIIARSRGEGSMMINSLRGQNAEYQLGGAGDIVTRQANVEKLVAVSSHSGELYFEGTAKTVEASFISSDANIYVAHAGQIRTNKMDSSNGKVIISN